MDPENKTTDVLGAGVMKAVVPLLNCAVDVPAMGVIELTATVEPVKLTEATPAATTEPAALAWPANAVALAPSAPEIAPSAPADPLNDTVDAPLAGVKSPAARPLDDSTEPTRASSSCE